MYYITYVHVVEDIIFVVYLKNEKNVQLWIRIYNLKNIIQ